MDWAFWLWAASLVLPLLVVVVGTVCLLLKVNPLAANLVNTVMRAVVAMWFIVPFSVLLLSPSAGRIAPLHWYSGLAAVMATLWVFPLCVVLWWTERKKCEGKGVYPFLALAAALLPAYLRWAEPAVVPILILEVAFIAGAIRYVKKHTFPLLRSADRPLKNPVVLVCPICLQESPSDMGDAGEEFPCGHDTSDRVVDFYREGDTYSCTAQGCEGFSTKDREELREHWRGHELGVEVHRKGVLIRDPRDPNLSIWGYEGVFANVHADGSALVLYDDKRLSDLSEEYDRLKRLLPVLRQENALLSTHRNQVTDETLVFSAGRLEVCEGRLRAIATALPPQIMAKKEAGV